MVGSGEEDVVCEAVVVEVVVKVDVLVDEEEDVDVDERLEELVDVAVAVDVADVEAEGRKYPSLRSASASYTQSARYRAETTWSQTPSAMPCDCSRARRATTVPHAPACQFR